MLRDNLEALSAPDQETRLQAIRALGEYGDRQAVSPLIALLANSSQDGDVRAEAATALGKIGDARAVDVLIEAVKERSEALLLAAAHALGRLGDSRAVEPLLRLVDRHHLIACKQAAAEALLALGAVTALVAAAQSGGSDTEWAIAKVLACAGHGEELLKAYSGEDRPNFKAAVSVWTDPKGSDALKTLLSALKSSHWDVRIRAAEALKHLADPRSAAALRAALGDSESSVRVAATEALRRIGEAPSEAELAASTTKVLAALGLRTTSELAASLTCLHCSARQAAAIWPVHGDQTPFYSQAEPGQFSIKLICLKCERPWYIAWDRDPGHFYPLQ